MFSLHGFLHINVDYLAPCWAIVAFILGYLGPSLGFDHLRTHVLTLSIVSALPVPMLGQVYLKMVILRGRSFKNGSSGAQK